VTKAEMSWSRGQPTIVVGESLFAPYDRAVNMFRRLDSNPGLLG